MRGRTFRLTLVGIAIALAVGACGANQEVSTDITQSDTSSSSSSPATPTTIESATTSELPLTTMPVTTVPQTTSTPSSVAAVPPMQCSWWDADPPGCSYWGYIKSVDVDRLTLVFDLARFESTGPEEYEYELINNNPLLRTLDMRAEVTVSACVSSQERPGECGGPDYAEFSLAELAAWVEGGHEFWGLWLEDDKVVLIEQWWQP